MWCLIEEYVNIPAYHHLRESATKDIAYFVYDSMSDPIEDHVLNPLWDLIRPDYDQGR
jgi:hypothetical protein